MAPRGPQPLIARDIGPGTIIPISLVVLLFLFVAIVSVAVQIQKHRARTARDRASEHQNDLNQETDYSIATPLRTYNPYVESPFPAQPASIAPIRSRVHDPQTEPFATYTSPVTPMRKTPGLPDWPQGFCTPQKGTIHDRNQSVTSERHFGDAREYILAIPEPLSLRKRSAEPATLPLRRSEYSYDLGPTTLLRTSKHPHPAKLFECISQPQQGLVEDEETMTRASETAGTITDSCRDSELELTDYQRPVTSQSEDLSAMAPVMTHSTGDTVSVADTSEVQSDAENLDSNGHHNNPSLTALHRLKTYRSLTGAKPPQPLTRAGTLTRPKAPVAEIREYYNHDTSDGSKFKRKHGLRSARTAETLKSGDAPVATLSTAPSSDALLMRTSSLKPGAQRFRSVSAGEATSQSSVLSGSTPHHLPDHKFSKIRKVFEENQHEHGIMQRGDPDSHVRVNPPRFLSSPLSVPENATVSSPAPSTATTSERLRPFVSGTADAASIRGHYTRGADEARVHVPSNFSLNLLRTPMSPYFVSNADRSSNTTTHMQIKQQKSAPSTTTLKSKIDEWDCSVSNASWSSLPLANSREQMCDTRSPHRLTGVGSEGSDPQRQSTISTDLHSLEADFRMSIPRMQIRNSEFITEGDQGSDEELRALPS